MRSIIGLVTCLLATIAFADDKKADAVRGRAMFVDEGAVPRKLSVSGKVVDSTGRPVAGATVYLREWLVWRKRQHIPFQDLNDILAITTTNDAGEFHFQDVDAVQFELHRWLIPGNPPWDIVAIAKGHGLAWRHWPKGAGPQPVTLALAPETKLTGRLIDEQGKPIAGARLQVGGIVHLNMAFGQRSDSPGFLELQDSRLPLAAMTDAEGRFTLGGLPPQVRCLIVPSHDRFVPAFFMAATTDEPQEKLHRTLFDDEANKIGERDYPIHTGDFTVMLKPGHVLPGQVVFEGEGKPASGARVVYWVEGRPRASFTDAEGRFTARQLTVGKTRISVFPPEKSDYLAAHLEPPIAADTQIAESLQIRLRRGAEISGQVVDEETGKPVSDATVLYDAHTGETPLPTARTAVDGTFRLVGAPGKGTVRLTGAPAGYFLPAPNPVPPALPTFQAIEASVDRPATGVKFNVSKGVVAGGRAVDPDGKPVAGAQVRVIGRSDVPLATTDAEGQFTLGGRFAPAQNLDVIIVHEQRKLAALVSARPDSAKNRLDTGAGRLEQLGVMTGRVVDEEQKPIAGAVVHVSAGVPIEVGPNRVFVSVTALPGRSVKTDADGKFALDFVVPGVRQTPTVSKEGYLFLAPRIATATFKPGEQRDFGDLTLAKANHTVTGIVVDPAGRALPDVSVHAFSRRGGAARSDQPVSTGKDGRFQIGNLPPGRVDIIASFLVSRSDAGRSVTTRLTTDADSENLRIVLFVPADKQAVAAFPNKPAPEFPVASWHHCKMSANQKAFTRAAFEGKVVVLAFVDEAKPSQRVLPQLQTLQEKLARQGLIVLRVHEMGEPEVLAKLSPLAAAAVPGGIPGYSEAAQKYGVRATPTLFVIDKKGVLRHADVEVEEVEIKINELLNE